MDTENKTAVLGFGAGLLLFYILIKAFKKKAKDEEPPAPTADTINIASTAYMEAYSAGEPDTKLMQINDELVKLYGLRVATTDGTTFTVSDLTGKVLTTINNNNNNN